MPKGIHNNKRGGRKREKPCTCREGKQCQSCIAQRYYERHKKEIGTRQMDRYYQRAERSREISDEELERRLNAKFGE